MRIIEACLILVICISAYIWLEVKPEAEQKIIKTGLGKKLMLIKERKVDAITVDGEVERD